MFPANSIWKSTWNETKSFAFPVLTIFPTLILNLKYTLPSALAQGNYGFDVKARRVLIQYRSRAKRRGLSQTTVTVGNVAVVYQADREHAFNNSHRAISKHEMD